MSRRTEPKTISFPITLWEEIDKHIHRTNSNIPGTYRGRAHFLEKVSKLELSKTIRTPKEIIREEIQDIRKQLNELEQAAVTKQHEKNIIAIRKGVVAIELQGDKLHE